MSHPFVYSTASTPPSDPTTVMAAFMAADPATAGPSLPPLSHLLPTSSTSAATAAIIDFAAAAAAAADGSHLADVIDLTCAKSESSAANCSGTYSFVPAAGQKKRPRRKYHEIERLYHCNFLGCSKAYGTLNHLNAHVAMQNHGPKRLPVEFKEMRKQWRKQKREQRAAEEAVAAVSGEYSIPSTAVRTSPTMATPDPTHRHTTTILTTSTQPMTTTTTTTTTFPSAAAAAASMMMAMDPESIAFSYPGPPPPPQVVSDHHPTSLILPPYMPWQSFVGPGPGPGPATVALPPY